MWIVDAEDALNGFPGECNRPGGAWDPRCAGNQFGRGTDNVTTRTIRVVLPHHLQTLSRTRGELQLSVNGAVTSQSVLDALEAAYPGLRGTVRDHVTGKRRPFLRFFACEEDLSHQPPDAPLPEAVANGVEPFIILGAVAGG